MNRCVLYGTEGCVAEIRDGGPEDSPVPEGELTQRAAAEEVSFPLTAEVRSTPRAPPSAGTRSASTGRLKSTVGFEGPNPPSKLADPLDPAAGRPPGSKLQSSAEVSSRPVSVAPRLFPWVGEPTTERFPRPRSGSRPTQGSQEP